MPRSDTPYPQSDRELIRLVERSPSHRAGYKQLIRELGLGGGRERRLLLEQLARITLRGDLIKLDTGHWTLPHTQKSGAPSHAASSREVRFDGSLTRDKPGAPGLASETWDGRQRITRDKLLAGKLDLHRDGFGFVRPNGSTRREDDLFIPPHELNGAMQGDEVLVDEAPPGRPGPDGKARPSGRILRILTRRNPTVVGIFHYAKPAGRNSKLSSFAAGVGSASPLAPRFNYVTPLDERMTQPVLIPDGPDGEVILPPASPEHRVVGEEAHRTDYQLPTINYQLSLEGLAVDVEITDFPSLSKPARGRILEVLGHPDDFGVDVEIVIRKHRLPYIFPAGVLVEAADAATLPLPPKPGAPRLDFETWDPNAANDWALRKDFRGLPIVTIDGETARDFDDAVNVQRLPNGNWQLQVHIADVSHYVHAGTALDLEARLRGTSVYFPDRAIPMLPPALSSGICSLLPDQDRLVLSCVAEIDGRGEVVEFELSEGIIRSARRMTYTQVQKILDGDSETRAAFIELVPAFEQMHELALLLNAKRHRRGSIDFDLPEPVIQFDPQGNMAAITRSERGWSNRLIEEFMLTANECVAHWLESLSSFANGGGSASAFPLPASIYRIHELPDPKRILDFEEVAATYGQTLGFSSLPVKKFTMKSDRRASRASSDRHGRRDSAPKQHEVPESIPVTPQMYQRLTAKIAGTPEERILSFLMLRSLKQARYSEKNEGHFALASPSYTHFTSPIRRYPDLIVHRLLRSALRAGASPTGGPILSTDPQPWSSKPTPKVRHSERSEESQYLHSSTRPHPRGAPSQTAPPFEVGSAPALLPPEELAAIALEASGAERRADDAERELMEWKKIKFMQSRIGEDFHATVLSCTKYGFFVELDDLFIEGLVPIQTISSSLPFGDPDRFVFRDTDRAIVGTSSGRVFKLGARVHVLLDRIDRPARRLQFALVPSAEPQSAPPRSLRKSKPAQPESFSSPTRSGKPGKTKSKTRDRHKKPKGKRR